MNSLRGRTIAIDICNTLADVVAEIESRLGKNPISGEYIHPGISKYPLFFEENLDVFLNAKVIGNSVDVIKELAKHNTIYYVTARPKVAELVTKIWLRKNDYPEAKIYFTNNKPKIAKALGVNLAIEDAPFEINRYIESGIEVMVKSQPYNINRFKNCFEWEDISFQLKAEADMK